MTFYLGNWWLHGTDKWLKRDELSCQNGSILIFYDKIVFFHNMYF